MIAECVGCQISLLPPPLETNSFCQGKFYKIKVYFEWKKKEFKKKVKNGLLFMNFLAFLSTNKQKRIKHFYTEFL